MPGKKLTVPKAIRANVVKTVGLVAVKPRSPDETFAELFHSTQTKNILGDNKAFVDLVPKKAPAMVLKAYQLEAQQPDFNLEDFIGRNFYNLTKTKDRSVDQPNLNPEQHIKQLWGDLTVTNRRDRGSLLALPYEYIVPGGRFQEQFYWDSYFIMLGLATENQWRLIEGMMKNYTYMIRRFGLIPTANRSYFLTRSQPPFFSHMVELLSQHRDDYATVEYLPYLLKERQFWMRGSRKLHSDYQAMRRVVRLPDDLILNRYFDDRPSPRPESYIQDIETVSTVTTEQYDSMYLHLRAAAESGWDFSSRWLADSHDLGTIHTTDIVPIDLNCLLYHLESTIAKAYRLIKQHKLAKTYETVAASRAAAIEQYCWNEQHQFFHDYDFVRREATPSATLAAMFPLYVGLASRKQAAAVATRLEQDFLRAGGLATTLIENDQQWDMPNGWAPLHYVTIKGLERYGHQKLADTIRQRWLATNRLVFERHHKFIEKYDVVHPGELGGGGEYELQDGFGWTNGVFETLSDTSLH